MPLRDKWAATRATVLGIGSSIFYGKLESEEGCGCGSKYRRRIQDSQGQQWYCVHPHLAGRYWINRNDLSRYKTHQGVGAAARPVREAREGDPAPRGRGLHLGIQQNDDAAVQVCSQRLRFQIRVHPTAVQEDSGWRRRRGNRLYDAVKDALNFQIGEEKKRSTVDADCFLVPFTDGMDNSSKTSLKTMMHQIIGAPINRLHIIFVTANLPQNSRLKEELEAALKVKALIEYETSKAGDMSRAFDDLRAQMKAILKVSVSLDHGRVVQSITNVEYGSSRTDVAKKVSKTLYGADAFRDAFNQLRLR